MATKKKTSEKEKTPVPHLFLRRNVIPVKGFEKPAMVFDVNESEGVMSIDRSNTYYSSSKEEVEIADYKLFNIEDFAHLRKDIKRKEYLTEYECVDRDNTIALSDSIVSELRDLLERRDRKEIINPRICVNLGNYAYVAFEEAESDEELVDRLVNEAEERAHDIAKFKTLAKKLGVDNVDNF